MKFNTIHFSIVWLFFQTTPLLVSGSSLRGPSLSSVAIDASSNDYKFEYDKRDRRHRAVEEEEGDATAVLDDLLLSKSKDVSMQSNIFVPERDVGNVTQNVSLGVLPSNSSLATQSPNGDGKNNTPAMTAGLDGDTVQPAVTCPTGGNAEVWVGHHGIIDDYDYTLSKIWVISSNPDHHNQFPETWMSVSEDWIPNDYKGEKSCAKYFEIDAGATDSGVLVAAINREEVSKALGDAVLVMKLSTKSLLTFKTNIDNANSVLNGNFELLNNDGNTILKYKAFPHSDWYARGYGWVDFNANGYISGLLNFLGHSKDKPYYDWYLTGWDKSVPKAFFEKTFTTAVELKEEVYKTHKCEGGLAEVWIGYHPIYSEEQKVWIDHAKIWVISSKPAHHRKLSVGDWKDLRRDRVPSGYQGDKNCAKFYTLGAGFTAPELEATVNYDDDVSFDLSGAALLLSGVNPITLNSKIDITSEKLKNNFANTSLQHNTAFPQDWNKWSFGWNEFNGNGYISGFVNYLMSLGWSINYFVLSDSNLPGWEKNIPIALYQKTFTSEAAVMEVVLKEQAQHV